VPGQLNAERATNDPRCSRGLPSTFWVSGRALPPAAVERAIALSHERYCSATAMLAKTATIETSFEIVES
jgi:putative redox protein